jgi:uncharacterized membrane protein
MRGFFRVLEGFVLFGLAFIFLKWFIKGLFGRYFYIFWIWLIVAIGMVVHDRATQEPYDHRTGAEVWEARYGKVN